MDSLDKSISFLRQKAELQWQDLFETLSVYYLSAGIDARPIPKKWSFSEQLVHLTHYAGHFQLRCQLIKQKEPVLERYVEQETVSWHQETKQAPHEIFDNYRQIRELVLEQLYANQQQIDWALRAAHPVLGHLTLLDWLAFFLHHEGHHIYTLFKMTKIQQQHGQ